MKGKRKMFACILAISMIVSLFNVPIGAANVQAGENEYEITFMNGNEVVNSYTVIKGETINSCPVPSIQDEYKVFGGYRIKDDSDNILYLNNWNEYNETDGTMGIYNYVPKGDTIFEAFTLSYPDDLYKVTIDGNGRDICLDYDNGVDLYKEKAVYYVRKGEKLSKAVKRDFSSLIGNYENGEIYQGFIVEGDENLYVTVKGPGTPDTEVYFGDYVPKSDTVMTADWGEKYSTITYKANGGYYSEEYYGYIYHSETHLRKTANGKSLGLNYRIPYREGYRILGYKIEGKEKIYYLSGPRAPQGVDYIEDYEVDGPVSFEAVWQKVYNATYRVNGGVFYKDYPKEEICSQFDEGKTPAIINVTRDGYLFTGWKVEDDTSLNGTVIEDLSSYVMGSDVIFTATWEEISEDDYYTVTYNLNGGYYHNGPTTVYDTPMTVEYPAETQTIQLKGVGQPDRPYKDGYELVGWMIEGDDTVYESAVRENGELVGGYYELTGDVTFTAVWKKYYVITYSTEYGQFGVNDNGEPELSFVDIMHDGDSIDSYVYPTSEDKMFVGYRVNDSNVILYNDEYLGTKGVNIDDPDYPTINGYTPTDDTTFNAVWDDKVYKITFEANGGYFGEPEDGKDTDVTFATIGGRIPSLIWPRTDEKKAFIGYSIKGDTSGKIYRTGAEAYEDGGFFKIIPEGDMVFEAVWADGCNVTIKYNGGKLDGEELEDDKMVFEKNHSFPEVEWYGTEWFPNIEKDGYVLKGWIIEGDESETIYENISDIMISDDMTISVVWINDCSKLGHIWDEGEVTRAATCTEKGVKSITCTVCGETKTEDIAATGHSWDDGFVTRAATCIAKGVKTYTCKNCKITKSEDIEAKGHVEVVDKAIAATTGSTGLTEGIHCSVCGKVIKEQKVVPKLEEEVSDKSVPEKQKTDESSTEEITPSLAEPQREAHGDISDGLYVINPDGTKVTNEWVNVNGSDYYIDATGYAAAGEYANGVWFDADGKKNDNYNMTWESNSTGYWIEDTSGWYPVSTWLKIDGYWYYFDASGYMETNAWRDGCWLGSNGAWTYPYTGSWKGDSSGWWFEDTSPWYPSSQWLKINGSWYYFDGSGYMVTSKYVDGYWIGADGVCQ